VEALASALRAPEQGAETLDGTLRLALEVLRCASSLPAALRRVCASILLPAAVPAAARRGVGELAPAVVAVQALLAACCARRCLPCSADHSLGIGGACVGSTCGPCTDRIKWALRGALRVSCHVVFVRPGNSVTKYMLCYHLSGSLGLMLCVPARAEGVEAAGAWVECQRQLLLLACQPHPVQLHLLSEVWAGVIGCAYQTLHRDFTLPHWTLSPAHPRAQVATNPSCSRPYSWPNAQVYQAQRQT